MKLNLSGALLMRGVRLLKGDETESKTEGVAKQDGESRKLIKKT